MSGVLTGPAIVFGTKGDKLEFSYKEGKIVINNLIRINEIIS